jgi:membrane-associated protease RseP (regulator of RpoE activity)
MSSQSTTKTGAVFTAMYLLSVFCVAADRDDGRIAGPQAPKVETKPGTMKAYLGVNVADLHPAIASHLPSIVLHGQGVIVEMVYVNSPAAKAGIREHDILLMYDDQKLFNRDQLVKLIANDQRDREVSIRLIRQGKETLVSVRLGERPANATPSHRVIEKPFSVIPVGEFLPRSRHDSDGINRFEMPRASWQQIEAIRVKRLDNDRFRATLSHSNKEGNLEKYEYEGTREELKKLIDADENLKPNERHHLFRSLDLQEFPNSWNPSPSGENSGY